jgi:hypothetical protein
MGRFCMDPLSKEQKPLNNDYFVDVREGQWRGRKGTLEARPARWPWL